jgi:hypothetical protein
MKQYLGAVILVAIMSLNSYAQEPAVQNTQPSVTAKDSVSITKVKGKKKKKTVEVPVVQKAEEKDTTSVPPVAQIPDSTKVQPVIDSTPAIIPTVIAPDTTVGLVIITSVPDSVMVVFDDAPKGKTPLTLPGVSAGEHVVILKKSGYFLKKATIVVSGGKETLINFDLIKPAVLKITSEPSGAFVNFNSTNVGTTPFMDGKFKPGQFVIMVSKEGYQTAEKNITVQSGGSDSLHVILASLKDTIPGTDKKDNQQAVKKEKTRGAKIFDRIALGVFLGFSLIILLVELAQDR